MDQVTETKLERFAESLEEETVVEAAANLLDFAEPNDANATLFLTMLHKSWQDKLGKRFIMKVVDSAGYHSGT